ncbi:MAG: hypothetical protein NWF07_10515, partial [Candidatus Bathyarchaeota archaeon]|nr:hypothetical protein [Candidatus Bathyarchaeota archaeon]
MQELADTCPLTLNCDRIENKGKVFDSDAIIITTNLANPAPLDYVNFEACSRRIDFLVYAEAPEVEKAKRDFPGQPDMWKNAFSPDFSHIKLSLAPQGGFDKNGNTPHGKGVMKTLTTGSLIARASGLLHERLDEYELQGPALTTFNFDRNKILAFRQLAAENKYGLMDTMRVGKQLKDVKTMSDLKQALKNIAIKKCQIVYNGGTYTLEADGKGSVKVDKVQSATVQTNNELAGALHHLRCARIRYYVKCVQEALYSIIQIAGAAFVTTRIAKRMNIQNLWSKPQVEDTEEMANKDGCLKPKDDEEFVVSSDDIKTEGKKGKNKSGRGKKHTAFSSKGLSDEEYDEYKRIREERNGKYSIEEYLQNRDRYYEGVAHMTVFPPRAAAVWTP